MYSVENSFKGLGGQTLFLNLTEKDTYADTIMALG